MDALRYENLIKLDPVPVQWIPRFEMFILDLPNFPLVYVHYYKDTLRLYGFPVSVNFVDFDNGVCIPQVRFLCNQNLDTDTNSYEIVKKELSERFGLTNRISKQDIVGACKGDARYESFFSEIWDSVIKTHHGDSIPYGKYYEEFYSILRFVSAWNTAGRGGRQQELRQVYWFLREYGERIKVDIPNYKFYEFFLLPTYDEVKSQTISGFSRFARLFGAIEKIWNLEFTQRESFEGKEVRSMHSGHSWPATRDKFVRHLNTKHVPNNLTADEAHELGLLVDMFDRFPPRAAGFVWSVMSLLTLDYENWSKDFIDKFYLKYFNNNKTVAIYPKVIACFLQQGFANESAIPMDSWILSFVKHPLGIYGPQREPNMTLTKQRYWELEEFFKSFDARAKLERLIWLISQSKKVNMNPVFDIVWCIRFGTTGDDGELRQQNPISCYQCDLRRKCVGYSSIENEYVWIVDGDISDAIRDTAKDNGCNFICSKTSSVPKKIERLASSKRVKKWLYVDEFSGLRMKPAYTTNLTGKQTIKDLMTDLERQPFSSNP